MAPYAGVENVTMLLILLLLGLQQLVNGPSGSMGYDLSIHIQNR